MSDFYDNIEKMRKEALKKIRKVPISCLIWGPNITSNKPTANCRKLLKQELSNLGHYACYSEDLYDPSSDVSNFLQQVAQAEVFDIVFSIPDSPGSIAEINQFARIPFLGPKIVAYLDSKWDEGFANKTLIEIQSPATCRIQPYVLADLPDFIVENSLNIVKRLQEFQYLNGRR